MSRPRPLAFRSLVTAVGLKASVPTPYTVSVGRTTSSPFSTAVTAAARPSARWDSSAQSNQALMSDHPATPARTSRPRRCDKSVAPCQVRVIPRVPPAALLGKHPVHGRTLLGAMLHGDEATRPQQSACRRLDGMHGVKTIGTAPQRSSRVILPHLGWHPSSDRNIRRIADDQVDLSVKLRERGREVFGMQPHTPRGMWRRLLQPGDVDLGPVPRKPIGYHGLEAAMWHFLSDRQGG